MGRFLPFFALALAMPHGMATAQPITNVNECTLIPDPIALKRCIDGFQLRGPSAQYPQSPPIPPVETPAQAERNAARQNLPPNVSYRDSPEWLERKGEPNEESKAAGGKRAPGSEKPASRDVIDLTRP